MSRVLESISPTRMGPGFRWLLASSWTTNLGDGIALAAGPLLVASQTHDPVLVALATVLQRLPWLLLGLYAGVVADRMNRKLIVMVANLFRAGVLVVLSVVIVTDQISVAIVLVALFLLGAAEAFVDTTTSTLLPMIVDKPDLGVANARLMFGHVAVNQLGGPPLGAALFALGMAWPFVTQAVALALGALLVTKIAVSASVDRVETYGIASEVAEGVRWLWRNPPIRTLSLAVFAFNLTFGAAWSVLVLYTIQRLDLGEIGFGLLLTSTAVGGILGTVWYGWLERKVRLAHLMRAGLIIETLTHLALAIITVPWVVMLVLFVFGMHLSVWGTTARSIRQRAVPDRFQGRIASVYMTGVHGGLVVGGIMGGVIAGIWGVTGPFWFGFFGSSTILILIWRQLEHIAHVD